MGAIFVLVSLSILFITARDSSRYLTFEEARERAENGEKSRVHVIGTFPPGAHSTVLSSSDNLSFTFSMVDASGDIQEVLHLNPIPTDFERSEQVVVVGSFRNDLFLADKILLKCPSKYEQTSVGEI